MKSLIPALLLVPLLAARAEYPAGSTPPDFTGTTTQPGLYGPEWTLSDQAGKIVLLHWGAWW